MSRWILPLLFICLTAPVVRAADPAVVTVELPCGLFIDVPANWCPPSNRENLGELKSSGRKLFTPTARTHFHANSDPDQTSSYASVTVNPAMDGPGEAAVRNLPAAELAAYSREEKERLTASFAEGGNDALTRFDPIKIVTIAGHPALLQDFSALRDKSSKTPITMRVQQVQLMVGKKLVKIALTYDESGTAMWKPVMAKMMESVRLQRGVAEPVATGGKTREFHLPYGMRVNIPTDWQLVDDDFNPIKDPAPGTSKTPDLKTPQSARYIFETGKGDEGAMVAIVMKSFDAYELNEKALSAIAAGKPGEQASRLEKIMPRHGSGEDAITRSGPPALLKVDGRNALKSRYTEEGTAGSLLTDEIFVPIGTRTISMQIVCPTRDLPRLAHAYQSIPLSWKIGTDSQRKEAGPPAAAVKKDAAPGSFTVEGTKYQLPSPRGMMRLDGISKKLDAIVGNLLAGDGMVLIAAFGTEEDVKVLERGERPALEQTLVVMRPREYPEDLKNGLPMKDIFKGLTMIDKEHLSETAKPELEERLEEIAKTGSTAAKIRRDAKGMLGASGKAELGIFAEGPGYYSTSSIEEGDVEESGARVGVLTARSTSMILVKDLIVKVDVVATYRKSTDLKWTRTTMAGFSDQLLKANP